jgi:hypothetical protein
MVQLSAVVQRGQTGSTLRRRQGESVMKRHVFAFVTAVSKIFEVKDNGKPLTVAFSGGTEFNFVNDVAHFDTSISSARKFAAAAATAGAIVLMTNQSEFDNAASNIRYWARGVPGS